MDTVQIKIPRGTRHQAPGRGRLGTPAALPQPGLRLMGVASLGLGAGLYSAEAPLPVLVLAFVPALVAMMVIAVRSSVAGPVAARAEVEHPQIEQALRRMGNEETDG